MKTVMVCLAAVLVTAAAGCGRREAGEEDTVTEERDAADRVRMEDVKRDAKRLAETTRSFTRQEREELEVRLQDLGNRLSARIEQLEQRRDNIEAEVRERMIETLKEQRAAAEAKLDQVKETGEEQWAERKKDAQEFMAGVEKWWRERWK